MAEGFLRVGLLVAIVSGAAQAARGDPPEPDLPRLREHVTTLASPAFGGRRGEGGRKAAEYLVSAFRDLGLEPVSVELGNPGDQPDGIVDSVEPSGTLQEGDQVTVSFWAKVPPGQEKQDDEGNDEG